MSAGILRHTVAVRHPETGQAVALRVGEPVPAWAKDLVQSDDLEHEAPAKKAAAKRSSK